MRTAIWISMVLSLALGAIGCDSKPPAPTPPASSSGGILDQVKARAAEKAAAAKLDGGASDAAAK